MYAVGKGNGLLGHKTLWATTTGCPTLAALALNLGGGRPDVRGSRLGFSPEMQF